MEKQTTIASSCFFLLYIATFTVAEVLEAHPHLHHQHNSHSSVKLFVFGNSYVDTGNIKKSVSPSWKEPYEITFPRKPAGQFSNGRVLTDYIGLFPFFLRKPILFYLFLFGGTGVFDTLVSGPNLTTQIDFFEQLLQQKVYAKNDVVKSSIALVLVAGNDYAAHFGRPGNDTKDLAMFTKFIIIKQLTVDLKRIHDLGVQKIAVTTIEPLGCLPSITSSLSYQNCNEFANMASMYHNQILLQKLEELNKETKNSAFIDLELYNAFMSAVKPPKHHQGNTTFQINTLKPCCVGVSNEYSCGTLDQTGAKKYII
ncbi:GDSL esterase/lipase At5g03610 [Prunus persica]|uniref:GDSL esterase/lipase At5g03610 n=1 Tax=Prunus persica TaxID=3760 RepID=UPI0009AB617D|nr:GDSL esterase/lipase At5g03610 [Prunus persica]